MNSIARSNFANGVNRFVKSVSAALMMAVAGVGMTAILTPAPANALPSFARQTGQPCASCHTAFPELTPFGRSFKLGGYTLGGGSVPAEADGSGDKTPAWVPPMAFMAIPSFTHTQKAVAPGDNAPFNDNDNLMLQQGSIFYGGAIAGDFGAFVQVTYDGPSSTWSWDNTDIRYANTGKILNTDVLFGVTGNNNPTVQDVWNTTPAWSYPYIAPALGYAPAASTMIEGAFAGQVVGMGGYTFIDNLVYLELTGYQTLSASALNDLGVDPMGTSSFDGVAPYWRLAVEPTWGNSSFEIGTFGMTASIEPMRISAFGTDRITDIGFDAEYQYINDKNAVTALASYILERQDLKASSNPALGLASNSSNDLNSIKAALSYVYDNTYSFTASYFNVNGTADPLLYGTLTGSPNSDGQIFEFAYLPFSHGGPKLWPWFNVRLGIQYTMYNSFDGGRSNYNGTGRDAWDNNDLLIYAWLML